MVNNMSPINQATNLIMFKIETIVRSAVGKTVVPLISNRHLIRFGGLGSGHGVAGKCFNIIILT